MSPRRTLTVMILAGSSALYAGCLSPDVSAPEAKEASAARSDALSVATYYTARLDDRRCAFPQCGGVFVAAANRKDTTCEDGTVAPECYVATLDTSGLGLLVTGPQGPIRDALKARFEESRAVLFGDLGSGPTGYATLIVRMAWIAPHDAVWRGDLFRATNNGVVCVAAPCPSFDEEFLNAGTIETIHGVRLGEIPGTDEEHGEAAKWLFTRNGIIVAGKNVVDENAGPAGPGTFVEANQAFLPLTSPRRR